MSEQPIHIVGGGLAGSEAAWQLAQRGHAVVLHEMRPEQPTDAHQTDQLAELVCSNSFRSDDATYNAVGLLHEEMRRAGSLVMACGDRAALPAGSALAVDRDEFSEAVTEAVLNHPRVELRREAVTGLPPAEWGRTIIATGPLTAEPLAESIKALTGEDELAFFDAIAPIVHRDSIDFDTAWFQSRYDKPGPRGTGADYINCPLDQATYEAFVDALLQADKTAFKDWETKTPYFEGCLPIEEIAARGRDTLRHGAMKPVGLTDPTTGERPHAVVQLRQDNALGTLFNIVGFQTKVRYREQAEIFRMIPGLEQARFARFGGIHRNTFINSPKLLDGLLQLRARPDLTFAGQITGCEGYIESAAVGMMAGWFAAAEAEGRAAPLPPATTALGALLRHITGGGDSELFQPMNVNFGLFPPLPGDERKKTRLKGRNRKEALSQRALADLGHWLAGEADQLSAAA